MRKSGILLHISSLSSPHGIGNLGRCAYEFIDFLSDSGVGYWQVLPVGPTGYGDSPYQTFSTFAGSPYLVDPDMLVEKGLIEPEDLLPCAPADPERVDYGALYRTRFTVFRKAYMAFMELDDGDDLKKEFLSFCEAEKEWLEDYALFMAIHDEFALGMLSWPRSYRLRDRQVTGRFAASHPDRIGLHRFIQFLFSKQWTAMKDYANSKGVEIIGDIPIYVSPDSRDVWGNPELFDLDSDGYPSHVAGVPPDAFSRDGQLWGNPVYAWDMHRATGYDWWNRRIRYSLKLFDAVRIDHFRGFESFYSIEAGEETAINGTWLPGPGMDLFSTLGIRNEGKLRIIAEDLGIITDPVRELLSETGFPGMKILQFAFDADLEANDGNYLPHSILPHSICYTGTHDNMTTLQWWEDLSEADRALALEYGGWDSDEDITDKLISMAFSTTAQLAVIPMQDWLGLGEEARMNRPSTTGSNWQWRMKEGRLTRELSERIKRKNAVYKR